MSAKRSRRSPSPMELLTKTWKLSADTQDVSTLLAESPPDASTLRAESPKIESTSLNHYLERQCSVPVEKAISLISATDRLTSRLGLPVEPFAVAFSSAFSGKQTARIESIRSLNIAELNALSLKDLLATVFELKHNLVKERAKTIETDVVAYLRGFGLLEHWYVFQSWVLRWYCPRATHLPSILLMLGTSSPVAVAVTSHERSGFDSETSTAMHDLQVSINIVVDMNFRRTSLFVYIFDEFDQLLHINNCLEHRILLASSEPDVHKLRYTMHRKDDNGFVCFKNDNDEVEHSCSFKLPPCMFELAALVPNYVEAISGMPHVGLFHEIASLRADALWWSCPEQLVVTLQDSTDIMPLGSPITKHFRASPEGWRLENGCCLNYSVSKKNSMETCCCLRDVDDIRTLILPPPSLSSVTPMFSASFQQQW